MIQVTDQMNQTIRLGKFPRRIVSLVPSQTELLYYLGCEDQVVGITKFCIHPNEWFRSKQRVGGTKNVNFEALHALKPDLIIANKEENSQGDIAELQKKYPVYMSDIFHLEHALKMIKDVGTLVGKFSAADALIQKVNQDFNNFPKFSGKVLYFIWSNPYMIAGQNTFIGDMIERLGFENAYPDPICRYEELTKEEIINLAPDHILLSSEPFPFKENHLLEMAEFYKGRIHLVDGEMFSWYGSRMLEMKAYFKKLRQEF